MGKILVIKGADFSENALSNVTVMSVVQGGYNIIPTSAEYGSISPVTSANYNRRLKTDPNSLIYLEAGSNIVFSGLSGNQEAHTPLRIDAAIYSSATPGKETIIGSLNGESTNYFPFNVEGRSTCRIDITHTGWYGFIFAGQDIASDITSLDDYNGAVRYNV